MVHLRDGDPEPDPVAARASRPSVVVVVAAAAARHRGAPGSGSGPGAGPGPGPGPGPGRPGDVGSVPAAWLAAADVVVAADDPSTADVVATVEAHPLASVALALLLRGAERRTVDDGLVAESTTYSMLQAGPEFAAWRASRPARPVRDDGRPRTRLDRAGDVVTVTLDRPSARNALDRALRDELLDALAVVAADPDVARVVLRGAGPAFCAGGDLDEFGTFPDPAAAHRIRLDRSVGRALAAVADRVEARLHGACYGSGLELPAFAGTVVADPGTRLALPEVALGLVPGAGGTVSLPARIGRHRTAWLALSGRELDAATALAWGLVDRVEPVEPAPTRTT